MVAAYRPLLTVARQKLEPPTTIGISCIPGEKGVIKQRTSSSSRVGEIFNATNQPISRTGTRNAKVLPFPVRPATGA